MRKIILLSILFMQINSQPKAQDNNGFPVRLKIENGIIEGNYDTHTGIQKYFGIPFAKPPVGDLRWKAPQSLDDWEEVKETKKFGPRPMQTNVFGMNKKNLPVDTWTDRFTDWLEMIGYLD